MTDNEHSALSERITKLDSKVDLLLQSTAKLSDAMTVVVKLEARHEYIGKELAALEAFDRAADARLKVLEATQPGFIKLEAHVTWLLRIVIGAVVAALLGVVLVKIPGG